MLPYLENKSETEDSARLNLSFYKYIHKLLPEMLPPQDIIFLLSV